MASMTSTTSCMTHRTSPDAQNVSTFEIAKDDLYQLGGRGSEARRLNWPLPVTANFLCGEWCGFCKAKNECRARAEANLELAQLRFQAASAPHGRGDRGHSRPAWTRWYRWASDIKEYALQQAVSGKEWHGWKLVEGRSNRRYTNEAAVIADGQRCGL